MTILPANDGLNKLNRMKTLSCLLSVLMSVAGIALGADPKKPAFQYKSEGIEVPAATADEPKVKSFGPETVKAAAKGRRCQGTSGTGLSG